MLFYILQKNCLKRCYTFFDTQDPVLNGTRVAPMLKVDTADGSKLKTTKERLPPEAGCSKLSFLKIHHPPFLVK
jgi:hypothetical protein